MYLKSLTLKGFKSFADKTILKFKPGITVIAGPNGSGKSNISDAVLWVLGEQSPRSLRGTAMEDVIFAGSSARPALGLAEITLCMDNSDKSIPLEFSEVTISRRLFRSGDSEYFINNSPCRLFDIQELLSDSAMGRECHSVISQGKLEEILTSKPEEKRLLIEEVAHVLKYKKRKEKAIKKLESMEQTLSRIRDISQEVHRQLRPIKSQAEKAQEYQKLTDELKTLELSQTIFELKEMQKRWEKLNLEEKQLKESFETFKNEFKQKETQIEEFQISLEEKRLFTGNLSEQRRHLAAIQERLHSSMLLLEEKGKHLIEKMSEIRQEIYRLEKQKTQKNKEITETNDRKKKTEEEISHIENTLNELKNSQENQTKKSSNLEETIENLEETLNKNTAYLSEIQHKLSDIDRKITLNEEKLKLIDSERNSNLTKISELNKLIEAKSKEREGFEGNIKNSRKEIKQLEEELNKVQLKLDNHLVKLSDLKIKSAECKSKSNALQGMNNNLTGYPEAVAWLLKKENKPQGIAGCLIDLIKISPKFEQALEAALGPDLFTVLCDTKETALNALGLIRRNSIQGGISFLPINNLPMPDTHKSNGQKLSDVIEINEKFKSAIEYLTRDIYLINEDSCLSDKTSSDLTFVTTNGKVFCPFKISYGNIAGNNSSEILNRKRELTALEDEKNKLTHGISTLEAEIKKDKERLAQTKENLASYQQKLNNESSQIEILKVTIHNFEADLIKLKDNLVKAENESNKLGEEIKIDKTTKENFSKESKNIVAKIDEAKKALQVFKVELNANHKEELTLSHKIMENEVNLKSLVNQKNHLNQQKEKLNQDLREIESLTESEHKISQALEVLVGRIQPTYELFTALYEKGNWWAAKLTDIASGDETFFEEIRRAFKKLKEEKEGCEAKKETLQEDLRLKELSRVQLEGQITSAVEKIVDEYDTPLEKALENYPLKISYSECQTKIGEIKRKISSLGPVNPMALEEFKELDERYEFLNEQINDLSHSKKALEKVTRAIDEKIKEKFAQTLVEVNKNFQSVFSYLFPGGKAEIVLEKEDNLLESGIEIQIQPQGKKLQKLSLLSGGETALAALAFLFALYFTRPSPFYILDEVEASLDEANLQRFINLLLRLKDKTQFLIITHQQRTMEMADTIYGTTMQADGVSKLISQKLNAEREAV